MGNPIQSVDLRQFQDYQFDVDFGRAVPALRTDEPAPLGEGLGPSPVQLLAAAVGDCLSSSLLFAMRKFKQHAEPIRCHLDAEVGRNADGRLRVLSIVAKLTIGTQAESHEHLDRVVQSFENYCTVTQSVRQAIDVQVQVFDSTGRQLK